MRVRIGSLLALVVVLGVVAASCSSGSSAGGGSSGGAQGSLTVNGDRANDHGSKNVSGASSATLDASNSGSNYFFDPTVLAGKAGQKLTITVKNTGDTVHNFTLAAGGANKDVQPGQSATVTVTFPSSGSLEFYCRFHRTFGMVGELTAS